jgi:TRAP-type C4-dicarboxylate transport system permease large subunit
VLLGSLAGMSIAGLLIAGVIPALILASLFCVYIVARCLANPGTRPALPAAGPHALGKLAPVRHLCGAAVGALRGGHRQPAERPGDADRIGRAGLRRGRRRGGRLPVAAWRGLVEAFAGTVKISIMILFIIAASQTFSQILSFSGATGGLIRLIGQFELTPLSILLGMILILLFLGCFIDQVSMLMVTVPIFVPLARAVGIESLVLGVVYLLTMEIGLLTPPFGLLLFVMRGVAPAEISMRQIYAAVTPFLAIKILVLALVVLVPGLGTWLPSLMGR